jgi:hypothetical protein
METKGAAILRSWRLFLLEAFVLRRTPQELGVSC